MIRLVLTKYEVSVLNARNEIIHKAIYEGFDQREAIKSARKHIQDRYFQVNCGDKLQYPITFIVD